MTDPCVKAHARGQAIGIFSPFTFIMTSVSVENDFRNIDLAAARYDYDDAKRLLYEAFERAPDKQRFLYEETIPAHEKCHLFDLVSTPFWLQLFWDTFYLVGDFSDLLIGLGRTLRRLVIPLREWAKLPGCPSGVRSFLDSYEKHREFFRLGPKPEPLSLPSESIPTKDRIPCVRIEIGGQYVPHIGFRTNRQIVFHPITAESIIEGLAWHCQLASMALIDGHIARAWVKHHEAHSEMWKYWSALRLAFASCGRDMHAVTDMFEFALMMPAPVTAVDEESRMHMTREELDPGRRFYFLAQEILRNGFDGGVAKNAERVCKERGWMLPKDVILMSIRWLEHSKVGMDCAAGVVFNEYRGFAVHAFKSRISRPFLGLDYPLIMLSGQILAPLHRKMRPDGTVEIKGGPNSQSWLCLALMSTIMEHSVEPESVKCPLGLAEPAVWPPDGSCKCENRKELERCRLTDMLKGYGIDSVETVHAHSR